MSVGDRVEPNKLMRLAGYGAAEAGTILELHEDEHGEKALVQSHRGARWWSTDWLQPQAEVGR